jgi:WD40 repeat protein
MPPSRSAKSDNRLIELWRTNRADHIISASWSSDGQAVAVAEISGPITIFNLKGEPLHQLKGHGFGTSAIDWQPGGTVLASVGQDGKVRLWNTHSGEEIAALPAGASWAECVAWSTDGQFLATSAGKKVRIWSATGQQLQEYADHGSTVADLAWEPGRNWLTVAAYGAVKSYDLIGAAPVQVREWKGSPLKLAWSPDGRCLAHGNQDATVHFWIHGEATPLQMSGFPTKVRELSWQMNSRYLATGGGAAVCIWDCIGAGPEGRTPQMLLEDDAELPLTAIQFQRQGFLIAAGGQDGLLRLWQPANKKTPCIGEATFPKTSVSHVNWSWNDKHLLVGTASGVVALFRV